MADDITQNTAIILRHMLRRSKAEHTVPSITQATGVIDVTARQNLIKLERLGWVVSKRDSRDGRRTPPPVRWMFTEAGRIAARAEVKTWSFEDVTVS